MGEVRGNKKDRGEIVAGVEKEELRTESRVLTCVSVSQGQAVVVSSFSYCPSESASELIYPSSADRKQTSDSSSNCRSTHLFCGDSDAAFSASYVTIR